MELSAESGIGEPGLTFDWTTGESVTAAVVEAVATVSGEDPTEMEPLYSAVDPDSLNALFDPIREQRGREDRVVEFPYNGVLVRVSATGDGYVFARE